jgi:acetyl-CoA carboxylase/biotin carboxylase 1
LSRVSLLTDMACAVAKDLVKYRKPKVQATMARLDEEYRALKAAAEDTSKSPEDKTAATAKLEAREKHLWPAYQSVALEFADLHDRSGRMKAKADCIPCDWDNSRRTIYWALRKKIQENVSHIRVEGGMSC